MLGLLLLLLLGRRGARRRLRHAHVRLLHRRGVMGLAGLGRAGLGLSVRRRRELHPLLVAAVHVLLILVGGRT